MKNLITIAGSIAIILALGMNQPASAQVKKTQPIGPISRESRTAVQSMQPITFHRSAAGQGSNRNEAVIASSKPLGKAPLLSGFRLSFENGDHRVRRIAIVPNDRTMTASLSDGNGDDPFEAGAAWHVPSHGAIGGSVTQGGGGVFDIDIPRGPAGSVLVLSGFDFKRADNSDANIRSFAVKLDSASSKARVTLLDDQGMDFTALAGAVATSFGFNTIGGPLGAMAAGASSFGAYGGFAPGGTRRDNPFRRYTATVHYAWVPSNAVGQEVSVTGSGIFAAQSSGTFPGDPDHVLTGFSFHFQNSDHFLMTVGMHLNGISQDMVGAGFARIRSPLSYVVSWQDNNRDDPIQWSADYRKLHRT